MACLTVKATCDIVPGFPLILSEEQEEILFEDVYQADPHESALIAPTDAIPYKPAADLTMIANAHDPNASMGGHFVAGLMLNDREYRFNVAPKKQWKYIDRSWRETNVLDDDGPAALSWRNAYGGPVSIEGDPPFDVIRSNPLGCGALDPEKMSKADTFAVARITDPDNGPTSVPWGCAPVPPWWQPRQQYAGTYDDTWLNEVHPRLPDDFDYRFYQLAAPQMIQQGYLIGGEPLLLTNVLPQDPMVNVSLPLWSPSVAIKLRTNEVASLQMNLDGCHIVLCGPRAKVTLTWRQWVPAADRVLGFQINVANLDALIRDKQAARTAQRPAAWGL